MPHIGTCGWIPPLKLNAERGEASKNVVTPEEMAFNAWGRIQLENTNCLSLKELVMHYQMKCFFLGKYCQKWALQKKIISKIDKDRTSGKNFKKILRCKQKVALLYLKLYQNRE